ncbi:MAG: 23S rRNA (adenine(2503)-C(2))-methyltransferase [Bdellovibrionales bacterium GWA2_49_15]|nr:MAG: 23S rRNA (adenine(2503)-C(2))-methyltransferase [Bdellovibrionales bacterium GWA2_49_15]HAZ12057.1 23S rRNA (adenine(2503)-C(2))-methyltransferase RlmN [Bdellovibrionales bacterium]
MKTEKSFFQTTFDELAVEFKQNGFPLYAAEQVYSWIYKHFILDVTAWTNVSKAVKAYLQENYSFDLPKVLWHGQSVDGTRKFLFGLQDGQSIETVLIPARERLTLCVSSQVGCAIGCRFCHTGTMGLKRNLEAWEVVGQLMAVAIMFNVKVTNVVYMGQGEPLHNFENMKQATLILMTHKGLALGQRKITLSTSGLVPQIERLSEFPPVNVAISLHAAHNNIRSELMPINKAYDLERLLKAIKGIPLKAHRFITYEYILIEGLNDRVEDAEALIELLDKKDSKVNIIPFNEYPASAFKRPSKEKTLWFQNLLNARGLVCTTRMTKGADILAACGQLKSEFEKLNVWNS